MFRESIEHLLHIYGNIDLKSMEHLRRYWKYIERILKIYGTSMGHLLKIHVKSNDI